MEFSGILLRFRLASLSFEHQLERKKGASRLFKGIAPMQLLARIRIVVLLLAAVLTYSGFRSALHPRRDVTFVKADPIAPGIPSEPRAEFVTSRSSRWFGIFRVLAGIGIAGCVFWQAWTSKVR